MPKASRLLEERIERNFGAKRVRRKGYGESVPNNVLADGTGIIEAKTRRAGNQCPAYLWEHLATGEPCKRRIPSYIRGWLSQARGYVDEGKLYFVILRLKGRWGRECVIMSIAVYREYYGEVGEVPIDYFLWGDLVVLDRDQFAAWFF